VSNRRTPRPRAWSILANQLDAGHLKRTHKLHERVDVAADHPVAGLHALDRGQRKTGKLGQSPLIDPEKRARRPQLAGGDHVAPPAGRG